MTATVPQAETIVIGAPLQERTLIAGMMQKYLTEQAKFSGMKAQGNGRFRYPQLDLYWQESERHAFLIQNGKRPIGFALVRQVTGGTTITEFFISEEHRHKGHGKNAAHDIFLRFPGKWAVREQMQDDVAQAFWRQVIKDVDAKYAERIETTKDGRSVTVQRFNVDQPTLLQI